MGRETRRLPQVRERLGQAGPLLALKRELLGDGGLLERALEQNLPPPAQGLFGLRAGRAPGRRVEIGPELGVQAARRRNAAGLIPRLVETLGEPAGKPGEPGRDEARVIARRQLGQPLPYPPPVLGARIGRRRKQRRIFGTRKFEHPAELQKFRPARRPARKY